MAKALKRLVPAVVIGVGAIGVSVLDFAKNCLFFFWCAAVLFCTVQILHKFTISWRGNNDVLEMHYAILACFAFYYYDYFSPVSKRCF